jgi:hypothetical protein
MQSRKARQDNEKNDFSSVGDFIATSGSVTFIVQPLVSLRSLRLGVKHMKNSG